jgi:hypothetical protein
MNLQEFLVVQIVINLVLPKEIRITLVQGLFLLPQ